MSERSAEQAYKILISALNEQGFLWVVAQIQEQIRAGKLIDKEISSQSVADIGEFALPQIGSSQASKRRRKGLTTEEYTPEEMLDIAVDAIEALAIHSAEMENDLGNFCKSAFTDEADIRFEPDELDTSEAVVFARPSEARRMKVDKLRGLLLEVRERGERR